MHFSSPLGHESTADAGGGDGYPLGYPRIFIDEFVKVLRVTQIVGGDPDLWTHGQLRPCSGVPTAYYQEVLNLVPARSYGQDIQE